MNEARPSPRSARRTRLLWPLGLAALLGACAVVPTGPSMLVLPGSTKTFDQFRADEMSCRQYASDSIGGSAQQVAADSTVRSAALGTVVGAVAGAAIGGSRGAGVGAGTGLVFGTAAGAGAGSASGYGAQTRYDHAYVQCMYAAGHRVPVSGRFTGEPVVGGPAAPAAAPATSSLPPGVPPPPPGTPPPPPPGVKAN